ncbi:MAG: hypothetical protein IPM64_10290 [Phycisphaerales bacterium]|nr:hypothetical protein [Phycisphaerales bacterium]
MNAGRKFNRLTSHIRIHALSLSLLIAAAGGSIAGCPMSNKPAADDPITPQSQQSTPGRPDSRTDQTGEKDPAGQRGFEGGAALRSRLIVSPETLLLTGIDDRVQLSAMIVDTDGKLRPVPAEWRSSDDSIIQISADGLASAAAELGSAQIFASAEGLSASPTLAVIARPAAGAMLVQDNQIAGEPAAVDPDAEFGVGFRMRARMNSDAAPAAGQIILGRGDKPIAGRVVEAAAAGDGAFDVTFEIVPVDDLFEQININQSIDMTHADYRIPDDTPSQYAVEELPDGTLQYVARHEPQATDDKAGGASKRQGASKSQQRAQAQGTRAIGPFECNAGQRPDRLDHPQHRVPPLTCVWTCALGRREALHRHGRAGALADDLPGTRRDSAGS